MAGPRKNARGRDMVISMLVILVPILVLYVFLTQNPEPRAEPVAVAPVLTKAEEESPYPVLRAENLPAEWVPVRVAWAADGDRWITGEPAVGNSWQLGYMAPNGIYVAVQQRDKSVPVFIADVTRDGHKEAEATEVGGRAWERWTSADERTRSLVWRDGEMVAVVTGDTDWEQLAAFAGALAES